MHIMKAASVAGLLSISILAQAGMNDETDRFTGTRRVSWSSVPSSPETFSFNTYAYAPEGQSPSYVLELLTWADTGQYHSCNFVNWLVDGRRATEIETVYEASAAGSATAERFTIKADQKTLEAFAAAKTIEYKVCGDEGIVKTTDLDGLRQVLAATR